jgi:hypothetical protein
LQVKRQERIAVDHSKTAWDAIGVDHAPESTRGAQCGLAIRHVPNPQPEPTSVTHVFLDEIPEVRNAVHDICHSE